MNVKRRPIELLGSITEDTDWYSVVISRIDDWNISPHYILNKVYLEGDDGQFEETNTTGIYKSCYATEKMFEEGIYKHPTHNLSTTLQVYNEMTLEQKEIVDSVKSIANNFPSAFFWHDGKSDDGCQFIGLHIHMLIASREQLSQVYNYRNMTTRLKRHGLDVKSQRVRNIDALTRHLLQPPRTLLGCNNMQLCGLITRIVDMNGAGDMGAVDLDINFNEDEEPIVDKSTVETGGAIKWMESRLNLRQQKDRLEKQSNQQLPCAGNYIEHLGSLDSNSAKSELERKNLAGNFENIVKGRNPTDIKVVKQSKTASKVDIIKDFVRKYGMKTVSDLLVAIMDTGSLQELETFRTLRLGPNFQMVFTQALQELEIESQQKGETFIDVFAERCPLMDNCMTIHRTAITFTDWCREQNIITGEFLLEMYSMLDCVYPKKNCLMLQGASNAGKTYWTDPLMSVPDMVGQTIPSQDFTFQNCVSKQIINIPELTFSKMEQVEEAKKIFEGLPTCVNVKNKEPARLGRTPVILTCNQVPWKQFDQESRPLQNRMFVH